MAPRILIIEDDPLQLAVFSDLLRITGHDTDPAGSLAEALSRLSGEPPDVILLDMSLRDGSGAEFFAQARACEAWTKVPVIVCTGHLDAEVQWKRDCSEWDALRILSKPFGLDELRAEIRAALRG